jgi:hypothetical protein
LVWISSKENRDISVEKQKIANMIKGDANIFIRKKWAKIFVHEKRSFSGVGGCLVCVLYISH